MREIPCVLQYFGMSSAPIVLGSKKVLHFPKLKENE